MEWEAPAIVLAARLYGEGDALATVLTAEHGAHRGLARGGASRARASTWQPGNLLQLRWLARLSDQLGSFNGELVHPGAALAMDDPLALAVLSSACAVAEGALTEREPHPGVFAGLLHLITRLSAGPAVLTRPGAMGADPARRARLRARPRPLRPHRRHRGAGLGLPPQRPRRERGRRRPLEGAAAAAARLPAWRRADAAGWAAGLALTGHFLARDAFGAQHRPLPAARDRLTDRVAALPGP